MERFKGLPAVIYKYRDWEDIHHKDILLKNELYLPNYEKFNDPFDMTLPYRYDEQALTPENIFKKLYQLGKQRWPNISEDELQLRCYKRQYSGAFENGNYWKEDYAEYKKTMKAWGVLSLSMKRDNILMWSHYSKSHTGFCIGFDPNIFVTELGGHFKPIKYSKEFPKIKMFDDPLSSLINLLTTKSEDWCYEKEYRVLKLDRANTVYNFSNDAVLEIILGLQMKESDKTAIIDICKKKFSKAKIFECYMNLNEYKLDLIPILGRMAK